MVEPVPAGADAVGAGARTPARGRLKAPRGARLLRRLDAAAQRFERRSPQGRVAPRHFDEAQRTYEKNRQVLRKKLEEDEADLILSSLEKSYPRGAVVIALVGHNQAINSGEMGIIAWFKAAKAHGWRYAISDETLALSEVASSGDWAHTSNRDTLGLGHLPHSLR